MSRPEPTPAWEVLEDEAIDRSIVRAVLTAIVLLLVSLAVIGCTLLDVQGSVRLTVTLVFALLAPGWALTAFLLPLPPAMEWTLATVLSIAVSISLTLLMLVSDVSAPLQAMLVLALVVTLVMVLHIGGMLQRRRLWRTVGPSS